MLGYRSLRGCGAGYVRSVADVSQEQAGASECQATWQAPRLPRLWAPSQGGAALAHCLQPSLLRRRHR